MERHFISCFNPSRQCKVAYPSDRFGDSRTRKSKCSLCISRRQIVCCFLAMVTTKGGKGVEQPKAPLQGAARRLRVATEPSEQLAASLGKKQEAWGGRKKIIYLDDAHPRALIVSVKNLALSSSVNGPSVRASKNNSVRGKIRAAFVSCLVCRAVFPPFSSTHAHSALVEQRGWKVMWLLGGDREVAQAGHQALLWPRPRSKEQRGSRRPHAIPPCLPAWRSSLRCVLAPLLMQFSSWE